MLLRCFRGSKGLGGHIEGALDPVAGVVQSEGDLITGGIAAVGSDFDEDLLLGSGICAALFLLPQLDLDHVSLQLVQNQLLVDNLLQAGKERTAAFCVVRLHGAGLFIAGDNNRGLAQNILPGFPGKSVCGV